MRPRTPFVMLAVLLAAACIRQPMPNAVRQSHSFPASAGKLVRLDVGPLDVHVDVAEAESISATVDLEVQSSSRNAASRWIERHTPVFDDSASVLEVRLPGQARHGLFIIGFLNTRARINLVVPPRCRLEVATSSGDVSIAGGATLAEPVRVNTSSGDVRVTGGLSALIADTSSGDVRVSGAPLTSFEADTSSGDVTLSGGAAQAVVDTSSGDVKLEELTGSLSADASSGDVSASWTRLPAGATLRARTSSGDVRFRIPAGTPLKGGISTHSGRLASDVAGTQEERGHQLSFTGTGEAIAVEIRTTSGDVFLHTRS